MEAYIVGGFRSAVGKSNKGTLKNLRSDEMAAQVIRGLLKQINTQKLGKIDDLIVGNAMPEAEQGLNLARFVSLLAFDTVEVPAYTLNRYCASGLEAIVNAAAKIQAGFADCIIAGGVESMSAIAMGGWRIAPSYPIAQKHPDWYWNMGLTAEAVAQKYQISREQQDAFALASHQKAIAALESKAFEKEIIPLEFMEIFLNENQERQEKKILFAADEGPRKDTTIAGLQKLKPVFDAQGTVTAGNASQTSDGAAFLALVSEKKLKATGLKPLAKIRSFAVVGNEPQIMGVAPIKAIPLALEKAGLQLKDIDLIELNEAFASQSVAIMKALDLDPQKLNIHGGAIALGHPLGATGAKLAVQLLHALEKQNKKYGLVSMCVGTGQGAAAIIERI